MDSLFLRIALANYPYDLFWLFFIFIYVETKKRVV